jgi:hypothetical protein
MNKINNGFDDIRVNITKIEEQPFRVIWDWYKQTWIKYQNINYNVSEYQRKACIDVLNHRALPTALENIEVQFEIKGLSRVALAQITRGRVGWVYNVESQMPQHVNHNVTIPKNIYDKYFDDVIRLACQSQDLYDEMYKAGIPAQDCRYILLHGQTTNMICGTNALALMNFFPRRMCNGLTDELNIICRLLREQIVLKIQREEISSDWFEILPKFEAMCARDKKCKNSDEVFKCCGRYGTKSKDSLYSFDQSGMAYELKSMRKELRLDNE